MVGALIAVLMSAAVAQVSGPQNLAFSEGESGHTPSGWQVPIDAASAGYTAELRRKGCIESTNCAVILPPTHQHDPAARGNLTQTIDATPYRGGSFEISAWLRLHTVGSNDSAGLWIRLDRPYKTGTTIDNLGVFPLNPLHWTKSNIRFAVPADAETLSFGIFSVGGGTTWVRDVAITPVTAIPRPDPVLVFSKLPGWSITPGFALNAATSGCKVGRPCYTLTRSPDATAPDGVLIRTISAEPFRNQVLRLRAWVKIDHPGRDGRAMLWLRVNGGSSANKDYRPALMSSEWTLCEILRRIEPADQNIDLGVMLVNAGRAWIDGISIEIAPEEPSDLSRDSAPSAEELTHVVNATAALAAAYSAQLPNFLCTETIHRTESRSGTDWHARDLLNVQLGYADGMEHYKLNTINGAPTSASYTSVRGALFEGEFGSMLLEIFRAHAAQFQWEGQDLVRGHSVHVIRYLMAAAKSGYNLHYAGPNGKTADLIAGHHGYVYIDRETNQVLRLTQIADLPRSFPIQSSSTTIDYDYSDVAGKRYLLPLKAEVLMGAATIQTRNQIDFTDYRKFGADSVIKFDDQ